MTRNITPALLLIALSHGSLFAQAGTLDPSFDENGIVSFGTNTSQYGPNLVRITSTGTILVAGSTQGGANYFVTALDQTGGGTGLDVSGQYDASGTLSTVQDAALQSDDKLIIVGECWAGAAKVMGVARFNSDGTLDASFSGDGLLIIDAGAQGCRANSVTLLEDGRILVSGGAYTFGNEPMPMLVMLNANGTLDTGFGTGGKQFLTTGSVFTEIWRTSVMDNGKIVAVGGYSGDDDASVLLARLSATGAPDATFNSTGWVAYTTSATYAHALHVQDDGSIVALLNGRSSAATRELVRYTSAGALDNTFDGDGSVDLSPYTGTLGTAMTLAVDDQGHYLIGGDDGDLHYGAIIVRLLANGALDTSFGTSGVFNLDQVSQYPYAVQDMELYQGKIVATGRSGPNISGPALVLRVFNDASTSVAANVATSFAAWPNPSADGLFHVRTNTAHVSSVLVMDARGALVRSITGPFTGNAIALDLSALSNGTYTLSLLTADGVAQHVQAILAH